MCSATEIDLVDPDTSYLSSPDTPSTIFPERLIRPLPKRSIKSRLSQEAVDAISYPPTLPSTSLPTYTHDEENGEYSNDSKVLVQHHGDDYDHDYDHDHDHDHEHDLECPHHHNHHCEHDNSFDDEIEYADSMDHMSRYIESSPRSPRSGRHTRYSTKGSLAAPDGYEAFENTNNKKKRKIPTSGSLSLHHSNMTSDFAHMGISGSKDGSSDDAHYPAAHAGGNSGLGVQGVGRGRNTRKLPGRNPLGVSVNGSNARSGPSKYDQNMTANAKAEESKDQGIISAAIANATALLSTPPGKGQENVGVLDQQLKQAHTNSQFTFTCETDAKGVTFPEQSLYSPGYSQRSNPVPAAQSAAKQKISTQGTQTSPNAPAPGSQQAGASQPSTGNPNAQGKKPRRRRRRGEVYELTAKHRRLQQEYDNLQHPPAPEDIWICEFCEYESIFGEAPHALIRQYEIKDRKEQRRLEEKRRLLEKAKLKGRKGKKQNKNAAKAVNHNTAPANGPVFDNHPLDQLGDDDLDYGYDDDPIPMPAPAPSATGKQATPVATASSEKPGGLGGGGCGRKR